jgi:hypothetical protein
MKVLAPCAATAGAEELEEADEVGAATLDEVGAATLDEVDAATLDEVDAATPEEVLVVFKMTPCKTRKDLSIFYESN